MIEHPENSGNLDPKNSPKNEPEISGSNEEIIEDENTSSGIDALAALRQDMFDEEQQPEPYTKPDLLQRMTGTLSSRKVPTRPRPPASSEQNFSIRSNRHVPPPEPFVKPTQGQSEEIHDEFLEERLGTGPFNLPASSESLQQPVTKGPIHIDGDPKAEGGLFSQSSEVSNVKPIDYSEQRGRRRMDPLWDNADEEDDESQDSSPGKSTELINRPLEERKMLGTGVERQYQVNKFLSYNPKRTWRERYQELSRVEKVLLVVLVFAVVMVVGLIVFLYLSSRQFNFPRISPLIFATQAVEPTPVVTVPIPSGLKLTGGWSLQLNQGALKDGKWLPTGNEWLYGTEIRRVIALPWNKQLDAVLNSLEPNNPIDLFMSNGDTLTFKVQSVSQVPVSDSSVMYDTRPSLAIILINPNSVMRLVVIAYP